MKTNRKILFLIPCSDLIPSGKVRILNYLPYLTEHSIDSKVLNYHYPLILRRCETLSSRKGLLSLFFRMVRRVLRYIDSLYQRWTELRLMVLAHRYHVIMIQWEPPPLWVIRRVLKRNPNLIFDYDDAVFLDRKINADFLIAHARMVIAGNQYLKDYAKSLNDNVVVIPSSIPLETFDLHRHESYRRRDSGTVIGWIGSQSTLHHVEILKDVFEVLGKENILQLKLIGIGNGKCPLSEKDNLKIETVKNYDEDEMIRYVFSFDIGIVPYKEIEMAHGKTALKGLIYMAAGIPLICTPIGENLEIIIDGVNGFIAFSSEDWIKKLRLLIQNISLRKEMGDKGLALVRERYDTKICFKLFYESLKLAL